MLSRTARPEPGIAEHCAALEQLPGPSVAAAGGLCVRILRRYYPDTHCYLHIYMYIKICINICVFCRIRGHTVIYIYIYVYMCI